MRQENAKLEKLYSYLLELPEGEFSKGKYEAQKRDIFGGEDERLEREVDQLQDELRFLEKYENNLQSDLETERESTVGKIILTKLDFLIAAAEEVVKSLED